MATSHFVLLSLVALTFWYDNAFAYDPKPLQDFLCCRFYYISSLTGERVNGFVCKDATLVQANDFSFSGLRKAGNTSNFLGAKTTNASVIEIPGLNTLGVSMTRVDLAPYGVNPPHVHPRASEMIFILKGTILVGFVTSNPENRLITKVRQKGDVFAVPMGLVHFQHNVGHKNAIIIAAFNSQNLGAITMANVVFGSSPDITITDEVLTKAFQVDKNTIDHMQSKF